MSQAKETKTIHLTNKKAIDLIRQRAEKEYRSLSNSLTATIIEHLGQNRADELIENVGKGQG